MTGSGVTVNRQNAFSQCMTDFRNPKKLMAETWFAAAKKADYGTIRSLGSKYFKVHNESDDGNTALLYAISSSNMQLISYLAPHGFVKLIYSGGMH